jgi:hypothetical protein
LNVVDLDSINNPLLDIYLLRKKCASIWASTQYLSADGKMPPERKQTRLNGKIIPVIVFSEVETGPIGARRLPVGNYILCLCLYVCGQTDFEFSPALIANDHAC